MTSSYLITSSINSRSLILKVLLGDVFLVRWLHGLGAWLPGGWADFTVFVRVLEGLDKTDVLRYLSSNWEIVLADVSEDTLVVNDVSSSQSASAVSKASIVRRNLMRQIRKHWNGHWSKTTLLSVLLGPLFV